MVTKQLLQLLPLLDKDGAKVGPRREGFQLSL